jgi:hypothetical protein
LNFLRLGKYKEAMVHLNDLLVDAGEQGDKNLQADARLGLALCRGMDADTELGFFNHTVTTDLGIVYQFYQWTAENIDLRSTYVGVTRRWLQGLELPPQGEDRPPQLQWLISLVEGGVRMAEQVSNDDALLSLSM